MVTKTLDFYEDLAEYYHLLFEDWDKSIGRQEKILNSLLVSQMGHDPLKLLDCACGIGTQAIGFAQSGHHVVASDLSQTAVARAKLETERHGLDISLRVSDMTSLAEIGESDFDVVTALDNALPHLTAVQIVEAARAISSKLKSNGLFIASIRDYDQLVVERPSVQEPAFYGKEGKRRIVHQVWDWIDHDRYQVHIYITTQSGELWTSHHFVSEYRCLLRGELSAALEFAGFEQVQWLMPQESGFYQPIVLARKNSERFAIA
jgi:SAM-dependent methyltransferase